MEVAGLLQEEHESEVSERRLRMIADNIPAFVAYVDAGLRYRFVNQRYVENYGLRVDEIIGKHVREVLGEDYYRRAAAQMEAALSGQSVSFEAQLTSPNRGTRWFGINYVPGEPPDGGVYVMALDITELKRREQIQSALYRISEAAQASQDLDGLFASIHAIIGELMPARNFYIALYDEAEDLIRFVYHVDEHDPTPPPYQPNKGLTAYVLRTGRPLLVPPEGYQDLILSGEVEITGVPAVDWIGIPLKTVAQKTVGIMAVQTYDPGIRYSEEDKNILLFVSTQVAMAIERKQAENALRQANARAEQGRRAAEEARHAAEAANRAKSTFLANMSHELRTPLNAILGFAELMTHDRLLTPQQHENLAIIGRSGEHLLALINDVLDLSRIEAGKIEVQPESFDLHEMLLGLGEMFSLRAEQKGLTVIFDLEPGVPQYIRADAGKLRQVLINLLGNAVKFTHRGGITLRVKHGVGAPTADVRLVFEVEDSGIGISTADLDGIFDPFVQTDSGRRSGQGTGLGLPISREYVHLMGGELAVRSRLDRGSTFVFDLPVQVIAGGQTAPPSFARRAIGLAPGQQAPDGGAYRLLVVDDDEPSRQRLVQLLAPLGFALCDVGNGQEAISMWRAWRPHLIWMDAHMPVLDGPAAVQQIKSECQAERPIIVLVTASPFDEGQRVVEMGGDDFIRKPFQEAQVLDVLARHLGVQFVYESSAQRESRALDPCLLHGVPDRWRSAMHEALATGDVEQMRALIDQLEGPPELLDDLRARVQQFDVEAILRWIG